MTKPNDDEMAAAAELDSADYDAQADLALPHTGDEGVVDDGFTPFAGQMVPDNGGPGYDVSRDIGA